MKEETKLKIEQKPGIYCIRNKCDGKRYIGLSNNIYKRITEHKRKLKNNIHINDYLQNAYNKHGKNNFEFYAIHYDKVENLSNLERYFIIKYKSMRGNNGYNLTSGGETNYKIDDEVVKIRAFKKSKPIIQFSLNNIPLCEHISTTNASRLYNCSESLISSVCRFEHKSSLGYVWRFKSDCEEYNLSQLDKPNIVKYPKIDKHEKVLQFTLDGKYIATHKSARSAHVQLNKNNRGDGSLIRMCCLHKRKTAYGYIWIGENEYLKNGLILDNHKRTEMGIPVARCNLTTQDILEVFPSASRAGEYERRQIQAVCRGQRKSYKGYYWKYILS